MIRYEFPWPPRELSPNARVHWRTLAKAKREYKEECGWTIIDGRTAGKVGYAFHTPPVTAQVTFVCDRRRRDADNHMAMLKPLWDALVATGVLVDDSHDKLRILDPKWATDNRKYVIVVLEGA